VPGETMPEWSRLRIGARGSNLSRIQTTEIANRLQAVWPDLEVVIETIITTGDKVLDTPLPLLGGKGAFTEELETALLQGQIDLAVHSLKDLPTRQTDGLTIGAIAERASVTDVLISRSGAGFADLPTGATIGTSSPRRAAQLLSARRDLQTESIRGNVETRLRKALDPNGPYDVIVLARAGLERLDLLETVTEELSLDLMLPAPGQGALAVQCRDDRAILDLLAPINHAATAFSTTAERSFLAGLGGGCSAPIAAYGRFDDDQLGLDGRVVAIDGSRQIDVHWRGACPDEMTAEAAGLTLAQEALANGATAFLGVST
jgi:hydroxymethylbilane synthase